MKINKIKTRIFTIISLAMVMITFLTFTATAQNKNNTPGYLEIFGKLKSVDEVPRHAVITVFRDSVKMKEYKPEENGRFDIKLPLNGVYYLTFSGYMMIGKTVRVSTFIADSSMLSFIYEYKFNVNLIGGYEPAETIGKITTPVVKIIYNKTFDGFDYDREYARDMRDQMMVSMKQAKPVASPFVF